MNLVISFDVNVQNSLQVYITTDNNLFENQDNCEHLWYEIDCFSSIKFEADMDNIPTFSCSFLSLNSNRIKNPSLSNTVIVLKDFVNGSNKTLTNENINIFQSEQLLIGRVTKCNLVADIENGITFAIEQENE